MADGTVCPHCRNALYDMDALRCLYCGRRLHRASGFLGRMRYAGPKVILIIIIAILLFSFILLIII